MCASSLLLPLLQGPPRSLDHQEGLLPLDLTTTVRDNTVKESCLSNRMCRSSPIIQATHHKRSLHIGFGDESDVAMMESGFVRGQGLLGFCVPLLLFFAF